MPATEKSKQNGLDRKKETEEEARHEQRDEGHEGLLRDEERRRNETERTSEVGREFISRSATWSHQRLV